MVDLRPVIQPLNGENAFDDVEWAAGFFLLVDKPFEWTSFDVVNKLRWCLKRITAKKKYKVGHAGTLDPRATGLLIIACGKATKSIESITSQSKSYRGVIKLGASTPTLDGEMDPDQFYPIDHIRDNMIEEAKTRFTGQIEQVPPVFSAIKKDGKRLYQYARKGQDVVPDPRTVTIEKLDLSWNNGDSIEFRCTCSKGTYIRSLARDIGSYLGSGAYLHSLVRTSIGEYELKQAWKLEKLVEVLENQIEKCR